MAVSEEEEQEEEGQVQENKKTLLLFSIFIAGACSIVYELLISACASYLLGDTIKQFSIIIGVYMASMGIGAYFIQFSKWQDAKIFVAIEIILGMIGGLSVPILFLIYPFDKNFQFTVLLIVGIIGCLTGMEIPLLSRLISPYKDIKANLSDILSFDYFGALLATILFPFLLLPYLGLYKSALVTGVSNLAIALLFIHYYKNTFSKKWLTLSLAFLALLITILSFSNYLEQSSEKMLYEDRIVLHEQTTFQKIVVTKRKNDVRLFLNGNLQFSSLDEHRYHETITHYPLSIINKISPLKVLILGGGDGLAVRELLKDQQVNHIDLVELDHRMIEISRSYPLLKKLNNGSLNSAKVTIHIKDALEYVEHCKQLYDLIIVDLPDPKNLKINKLYTKSFYYLLNQRLKQDGLVITQATSPYFAIKSFSCIVNTFKDVWKNTLRLRLNVPSFGEWGFVIGSNKGINTPKLKKNIPFKFLNKDALKVLVFFPKDETVKKTGVNTLMHPILVDYYAREWTKW